MALLPLAHRHARAVPVPVRNLRLLVVVVPAGAQGGAKLVLVVREALRARSRGLRLEGGRGGDTVTALDGCSGRA